MSCAPFLIALSSSGNRHDSVSRESSVHSMISSSSPLMKSIIPIGRFAPFDQLAIPNAPLPTTPKFQFPTPNNSQLGNWELGVGSGWTLGVGRWEFTRRRLTRGFQRGSDAREIGRFVRVAAPVPFRHLAEGA